MRPSSAPTLRDLLETRPRRRFTFLLLGAVNCTLRTLLVQRRDSQQCGFSETIVSQENSSANTQDNSTGTRGRASAVQARPRSSHALNAGSGRHRGRRLPAQLIAARDARELGSVSHATGDAARSRAVELPNSTRSACRRFGIRGTIPLSRDASL